MGTDIYLIWDHQTKEEKEKQYTGFSIDSGQVGYLRASIGMTTENCILRAVFPERYWESKEPAPYDFKSPENIKKLNASAIAYLIRVLTGKQVSHVRHKHVEKFGKDLHAKLSAMGSNEVEFSQNMDIRSAVMWLNSLYNFFELGQQKQEKGLNPRVFISW